MSNTEPNTEPDDEQEFREGPADYYRRRSGQIAAEIAESTGRLTSLMLFLMVLAGASLLFFYQGFIRHAMPLWAGLIPDRKSVV